MDAMSAAIDGCEMMLFGVSLKYKESGNCRLEGQYAHQLGVDMVPLMMQVMTQPMQAQLPAAHIAVARSAHASCCLRLHITLRPLAVGPRWRVLAHSCIGPRCSVTTSPRVG